MRQRPGAESGVWGWGAHQEAEETFLFFPKFILGWEDQPKQSLWCQGKTPGVLLPLGRRRWRAGGRLIFSSKSQPLKSPGWIFALLGRSELLTEKKIKDSRPESSFSDGFGLSFYSIYYLWALSPLLWWTLQAPPSGGVVGKSRCNQLQEDIHIMLF